MRWKYEQWFEACKTKNKERKLNTKWEKYEKKSLKQYLEGWYEKEKWDEKHRTKKNIKWKNTQKLKKSVYKNDKKKVEACKRY